MASIDLYVPEGRNKRRRRRAYFVLGLIILIICLLVLGVSWIIFKSSFFHVKSIAVTGNKNVSQEDVMGLLKSKILRGSFIGAVLGFDNFFIWPGSLGAADLTMVPAIKNLEIVKNNSARSIVVKVNERSAYGIWCLMSAQNTPAGVAGSSSEPESSASRCWWFDDEGVIFRGAVPAEGSLILAVHDFSQSSLGLNSKILPKQFISNLLSVFKVLAASGLGVKEIKLKDLSLEELEVDTYGGPVLYFSLRFPADNDLAVIQNLMSKPGFNKLEYLDFRVENRAYYK